MNKLDALRKLLQDLTPTAQNKLHNKAESIFYTARKHVNAKGPAVDYSKSPGCELLSNIMPYLHQLLQNSPNDPQGKKYARECEMLYTIQKLQMPMDFDSLSAIIAQLCQNIDAYVQQNRIPNPQIINLLYTLSHIDLNFTPELRKAGRSLIRTLFNTVNWKVCSYDESIQLLWSNALLSLYKADTQGNSNHNATDFLPWQHVLLILKQIEAAVLPSKVLDEKQARQLYQIYAANYKNRNQFPKALFNLMTSFLTVFQQDAHGSKFEEKVHIIFDTVTDTFAKKYSYIDWKKQLLVGNPIMDFGAETDILFFDPETKVTLAFQVDGMKYHSFPAFNPKERRLNLKTQFRNFCFEQAQCLQLEIKDDEVHLRQRLEADFTEHLLFPIHQILLQREIDALKLHAKAISLEITDKQRQIKEFQNSLPEDKQLSDVEKQCESYKARLQKLKHIVPNTEAIEVNLQHVEKKISQFREQHLQANDGLKCLISFSQDLCELNEKIIQAQKQLCNLKRAIMAARKQLFDLSTSITVLDAKLEEKKKAFKQQPVVNQQAHENKVKAVNAEGVRFNKIVKLIRGTDALNLSVEDQEFFYKTLEITDYSVITQKKELRNLRKILKKALDACSVDGQVICNVGDIQEIEASFQKQVQFEKEIREDEFKLEELSAQRAIVDNDLYQLEQALTTIDYLTKPAECLSVKITKLLSNLKYEIASGYGNAAETLNFDLLKVAEHLNQLEATCQVAQLKQIEVNLNTLHMDNANNAKENVAPNPSGFMPKYESKTVKGMNDTCKVEGSVQSFMKPKQVLTLAKKKM